MKPRTKRVLTALDMVRKEGASLSAAARLTGCNLRSVRRALRAVERETAAADSQQSAHVEQAIDQSTPAEIQR